MSNLVITESTLGDEGLKSLMILLAEGFLAAKRARGHPINFVNSNSPSQAIAEFGQTARVLLSPSVASTLVSPGADLVYDDTVGTSVDVTLNKFRRTAFGYSQVAEALDGGHSVASVTEGHMSGLFNDIEADVLSIATSLHTNVVGTYGADVTDEVIAAAFGKLADAYVPEGAPLVGYLHQGPSAWQAFTAIPYVRQYYNTGEKSPDKIATYGSSPILHKSIGWMLSQSVKRTSGTFTYAHTNNIAFHRDAILMAMKPLRVPTVKGVEAMNFRDADSGIEFQILKQWDPKQTAEILVIQALYGIALGREDWAVLIKSGE
ncbi:MAG TPA: hypothetical protein VGP72_16550 [Planctomycetota bacterium]|jgi:hypothetical protein